MRKETMGEETIRHVRGETRFIDDHPQPEGLLFAAVLPSPVAKGILKTLDTAAARQTEGVVAVFSAEDVPGENQIGGIFKDEPLFAHEEIMFRGQPLAMVVAESERAAKQGRNKIKTEIEELPPVLDPREAHRNGDIIGTPRIFSCGHIESSWEDCDVVVAGRVEIGGQEHLYLETQGAFSEPREDGSIKTVSATQSPTHIQKITARVLGCPMHKIEVDVPRLGGAFGGKEEQATAWACMTAMAAYLLGKPVKLLLHRHDDMRFTGKRHPYSSDFRLGVKKDGTFIAYEVTLYQNAGACADLSTAVLERSMFHVTGSYFIPNVKATGLSCRTNLPPNTAFRGFGGPQAMFVMEAAIAKAAEALETSTAALQQKNLLSEGDDFPFGMKATACCARTCFEQARERFDYPAWLERVDRFNATSTTVKKGLALMPVCFGISFTTITLNQAGALVHVYLDGSVGVSTGAVEMGQGVNKKIIQVAATIFGLPAEAVRMETTNTTRVANTSPTAASTGADLNGKATEQACTSIRERLLHFAAELLAEKDETGLSLQEGHVYRNGARTELDWETLVREAYGNRINLSAHAHYATPAIHFDKKTEKGKPFAYHVYGTAIVEATLDCLRGTYRFDAVKVVHDAGISMNQLIDRGQSEGAIVQGLGWLTLEELLYTGEGRLLSDTMSNYKIPDMYSTPEELEVHFLEDSPNPMGIFNSKAIGEPPFMYGIGGYYALLAAIGEFRKQQHPEKPWLDDDYTISAPLTPERVLLSLYPEQGNGDYKHYNKGE